MQKPHKPPFSQIPKLHFGSNRRLIIETGIYLKAKNAIATSKEA